MSEIMDLQILYFQRRRLPSVAIQTVIEPADLISVTFGTIVCYLLPLSVYMHVCLFLILHELRRE